MSDQICEENVFKEVYFAHSETLKNFLYYKSGDLSMSEDLTQDAFAKLWENCAKVSLEKSRSFLFTIANNLFFNIKNRDKVKLKFKSRSTSHSNVNDPQFILEEKEFKEKLELAISDLDEGVRLVFLMNRIDKMKYREIAEELNLSVKAVEKRMHKALQTLRKIHKKM